MNYDYESFREELLSELSDALQERGYQVDIRDITTHKPNEDLDGVSVSLDEAAVSPTLYVSSIFENYDPEEKSVRQLAGELADTTEHAYDRFEEIGFRPSDFTKEYVLEHSQIAVINTDMNEEFLSNIPHETVSGTDLSAYVKIGVGEDAFVTLNNDHAFQLGMTGSELLQAAKENTGRDHYSVRSMIETLNDMLPPELAKDDPSVFPDSGPSIYVITSEKKVDGANAILYPEVLDEACKKLGTDTIVLLPSSRHELLAVDPENMGMGSTADLKHMVETVNETEVDLRDKLSDNIYEYNGATHQLQMCDGNGMFPERDLQNEFLEQMERSRK